MLRRMAILVLYAHWEGFAKQAVNTYANLSLGESNLQNLRSNFVALGGNAIREAGRSDRMQLYVNVIEFATFNQNRAKFPYQGAFSLGTTSSSRVALRTCSRLLESRVMIFYIPFIAD